MLATIEQARAGADTYSDFDGCYDTLRKLEPTIWYDWRTGEKLFYNEDGAEIQSRFCKSVQYNAFRKQCAKEITPTRNSLYAVFCGGVLRRNMMARIVFCVARNPMRSRSERIAICGENRNRYSKTDNDATFMRFKKDHMKNDRLLPGYNLQMVICDEMIAHFGVFAFASDMDCFQPLMDGFNTRYGIWQLQ